MFRVIFSFNDDWNGHPCRSLEEFSSREKAVKFAEKVCREEDVLDFWIEEVGQPADSEFSAAKRSE